MPACIVAETVTCLRSVSGCLYAHERVLWGHSAGNVPLHNQLRQLEATRANTRRQSPQGVIWKGVKPSNSSVRYFLSIRCFRAVPAELAISQAICSE
jgi:hypothetical protein